MQKIRPTKSSIVFGQIFEIGNGRITFEVRLVRLLRQYAGLHSEFPTPLRGLLCLPRPVKPTPGLLETVHLRLCKHLQELFVRPAVRARICVCGVTRARWVCGWTGRRQDHRGRVLGVHGAGPSRPDVDVIQVFCAICICL